LKGYLLAIGYAGMAGEKLEDRFSLKAIRTFSHPAKNN